VSALSLSYPTLRSGRSDATRLEQILEWAGEDFDGLIVFDEAHAMANAAGGEGSRGKVVKRRSKGTPYRRRRGTPFSDMMLVS